MQWGRCLLNSEKRLDIAARVGVGYRASCAVIHDEKYEDRRGTKYAQLADEESSNQVAACSTFPCFLIVPQTRDSYQNEPANWFHFFIPQLKY